MIWVLNQDLGLSAREAFTERPHWELSALLKERNERLREQEREERKAARSQ